MFSSLVESKIISLVSLKIGLKHTVIPDPHFWTSPTSTAHPTTDTSRTGSDVRREWQRNQSQWQPAAKRFHHWRVWHGAVVKMMDPQDLMKIVKQERVWGPPMLRHTYFKTHLCRKISETLGFLGNSLLIIPCPTIMKLPKWSRFSGSQWLSIMEFPPKHSGILPAQINSPMPLAQPADASSPNENLLVHDESHGSEWYGRCSGYYHAIT